jgi:hypothetical protein
MKDVCMLLSVLFVLAACSKAPEKLEDAGHGILKISDSHVAAGKDTMIIDVKANTSLWGFASDSEAIFKDFKQYFPAALDKYEKIWVFANADLVDNYGNKSVDRTFGIEWPTAEIKRAHIGSDSFTLFGLLNLASDVRGFNRVGHDEIIAYCKDEANLKYTRQFCALYLVNYNK